MMPKPAPGAGRPAAAGRGLRTRRRRPADAPTAQLLDLDLHRITTALAQRSRYRYVQPTVERASPGWTVRSPNCSRNIDADGGVIDIAWFEPDGSGHWHLHARDHERQAWVRKASGLTLPQALAIVNTDSARVYWP